MMNAVEAMWLRLREALSAFADRVAAAHPTVTQDLGRTANAAFLLRGYLTFKRSTDGDEIAITVDVRRDGNALTFESDAGFDDGRVLAVGPSATIVLAGSGVNFESAVNSWLRELERFLLDVEPAVLAAISRIAGAGSGTVA